MAGPGIGLPDLRLIWIHLSREALWLGSLWMSAGILFGAIRSRGFRAEVASFDAPPEGPLAE